MHVNEREILEAALLGYQSKVSDLQDKMREIVARLNPEPEDEPATLSLASYRQQIQKPKRRFSAESRAKMAAAQRRRWKLVKRAAA